MDSVSYLASIRAQALTGAGKRAQSKARLLDDGDLNIGNIVQITSPGGTQTKPTLNPDRILNLDALSPTGQMVSVVFSASLPPGGMSAVVGPMTGIVEFGNGAVFSRVEVDIPIGPYDLAGTNSKQPLDGGTIVTVPGGVIRAYARNDANLVTTDVTGSTGPAASFIAPATTAIVSVLAKAHAVYYVRAGSAAPRKTLYTGNASPTGAFPYSIPAYARRFRLLRGRGTNTRVFTVSFLDGASAGANVLDTAIFDPAVPAMAVPFVDIPGVANAILITGVGGVITTPVYLEFEIVF